MKRTWRSALKTLFRVFSVILSLNLLASGLLVATMQSRNDIYLPLTGANPPHDEAAEVMAPGGRWYDTEPCQQLEIQSEDGLTLRARAWSRPGCHRWVMAVHGYSASSGAMLDTGGMLWGAGYNVLLPDLRAHGDSDGDIVGMGWNDRWDILLWLDELIRIDPEARVALMGVSMGGSAVLMASGETLPENVFAVVSDCAYTSLGELMKYHLKSDLGLPPFPVANLGSLISKVAAGYGWNEASAIEQVKKSAVPTLFIHGGDDVFVPVEMVYELYDAATCPKQLLVVGGAGHAMSRYTDQELYDDTLLTFLGKYVR